MLRRTIELILLLTLIAAVPSCRRIEAPPAGNVPHEELNDRADLPTDWGRLVSVTNSALYPELLQLWFQDDAGNIRMVVYSVPRGVFLNMRLMRRQ